MDRQARRSAGESGGTARNPLRPIRGQSAIYGHEAVKALTGVTHCRPLEIGGKARIPRLPRLARVLLSPPHVPLISEKDVEFQHTAIKPSRVVTGTKLRGAEKVARIPVKIIPTEELPRKPDWIRVRIPVTPEVERIKQLLRQHKLHSVCEEASCPNLGECFSGGTATFMIMGDICTR
ncbi:MAG: hypothetical protein NDI93_16265, partial [Pseudomonas sp.]|nr:hypothetical protein [Pseudomonas sp.]